MSTEQIYLDYAAASPLDERVLRVMAPYFETHFYNPSAAYLAARSVRRDVNVARESVAKALGARDSEIIFTAGATESINIAISGVMAVNTSGNFVTTSAEHAAVISLAERYKARMVAVDPHGFASSSAILSTIDDATVLVSISYVNNELGTVQPIKEIAAAVEKVRADRRSRGVKVPIYLHTDASQAAGHLDLHVARLGVDLLTLNAAKIYGPKQVGLLYVRTGVQLAPIISGGGQERALRSGTENVPGIIGFAEALRLAEISRQDDAARMRMLHQEATKYLQAIGETIINTHSKRFSPHILSVSFDGIDGERLVMDLDEHGVMAATGSACAANRGTKSHVLVAIGLSENQVAGSLRLSFGRTTSEIELRAALLIIGELVKKQRANHA